MDFTEPESSIGRAEMPKPPGYSEMHAADLDDTKVATKKVDQMSLKLKVKSVALHPANARNLRSALGVDLRGQRSELAVELAG